MGNVAFRCFALILAASCLASCTTHDERFDRIVGPLGQPSDTVSREVQDAAGLIIRHYESTASSLPTVTLALLGRSAADGYLAIRDRFGPRADFLRAAARTYVDSLARRAIRVGGGQAYGTSASRPDAALTADVGNAFVDVFLTTGERRYAAAASSIVRALVSRSRRWRGTVVLTSRQLRTRAVPYGIVTRGTRRYDVAASATVGLFLKRAADVDISAGSDGVPPSQPRHTQLIAQKQDSMRAFAIVAKQLSSAQPSAYAGERRPMNLTQLATTVGAAMGATPTRLGALAATHLMQLGSLAFFPDGQPQRAAFGAPAGVSIAALSPGSITAQWAYDWALNNRRADGTFRVSSKDDSIAQAYYAFAFEREVFLLQRGALQTP